MLKRINEEISQCHPVEDVDRLIELNELKAETEKIVNAADERYSRANASLSAGNLAQKMIAAGICGAIAKLPLP